MQYNNSLVRGKKRSEKKYEKKECKCSEEKSLHYYHVMMSCCHYAIPVAIDLNQTEYRVVVVVVVVTRRKECKQSETENTDQATEIQIKHHTNLQFLHNSLLFRVAAVAT